MKSSNEADPSPSAQNLAENPFRQAALEAYSSAFSNTAAEPLAEPLFYGHWDLCELLAAAVLYETELQGWEKSAVRKALAGSSPVKRAEVLLCCANFVAHPWMSWGDAPRLAPLREASRFGNLPALAQRASECAEHPGPRAGKASKFAHFAVLGLRNVWRQSSALRMKKSDKKMIRSGLIAAAVLTGGGAAYAGLGAWAALAAGGSLGVAHAVSLGSTIAAGAAQALMFSKIGQTFGAESIAALDFTDAFTSMALESGIAERAGSFAPDDCFERLSSGRTAEMPGGIPDLRCQDAEQLAAAGLMTQAEADACNAMRGDPKTLAENLFAKLEALDLSSKCSARSDSFGLGVLRKNPAL